MFLLIFVLVLSVIGIIQARKKLNRRFLKDYNELKKLDDNYESLIKESETLKTQHGYLDSEYKNITALYEVTKNISITLNREDVFKAFREVLKSFIHIDNCILLKGGELETKRKDYFIFSLKIEQEDAEVLAVKGLRNEDKNKFVILANQFALVLKRAELYRTIQELSITDDLTQVLVKRYCLIRLKEEFFRSKSKKLNLSCLMFDIDNFKDCNDKFGHLVGDVILRDVSGIIKDNIREIDLLGRFGGEEFLLILPETNKQAALFAAERIRKAIEEKPIKAYDQLLKVTISAGIASFPEDSDNHKNLIDRADGALYQAKHLGKNRVCLYSTK